MYVNYINCTVNMGLAVGGKSVFSTSFGRDRVQGADSHLKNISV